MMSEMRRAEVMLILAAEQLNSRVHELLRRGTKKKRRRKKTASYSRWRCACLGAPLLNWSQWKLHKECINLSVRSCGHLRLCCVIVTYCKRVTKSILCRSVRVSVCLYKEGVADRMLCVSSLQHPLCCHGETVLCFPIGGEINTIFNWPRGLPPCVGDSLSCAPRTHTDFKMAIISLPHGYCHF